MAEESLQEDGNDIRRRALIRLGIAAIVTSAALAGLWWLDQSGKQDTSKTPPPPKPIVTAPPSALAPLDAQPPEGVAETTPPAAPPTPEVGKLPPEPQPAAPAKPAAAPAKPAPIPSTRPAPAKPAAPAAQAPAATGNFVVQLGVFGNMDNAKELVERLTKLGIKTQTETRVQVGPFLNRAEAEKAQAEMRKLGLNPTITTQTPQAGARK
ncbi:MAG: SPOR domain-containing protein [Betaproteobacteria bacterium]|nr:SPOR domain-containing protein [Betaproteobacteria bacterium]